MKKTNAKALEAAVAEMNGFLQGVLNLRNSGLVDAAFANEKVPAEEALLSDVLQMVLRGYGTHNPLGQKEGGVRVKLVLDNAVPFGFLKDEDRIALQNDCCADCGARIGRQAWASGGRVRCRRPVQEGLPLLRVQPLLLLPELPQQQHLHHPRAAGVIVGLQELPVANVCAEYLRSIFDQPLICVSSVNPELMEKVGVIEASEA